MIVKKLIFNERNRFITLALIVPVALLLCFVVYPIIELIRMSFTDWDGLSLTKTFIGLQNYKEMLFDSPNLWISLKNNGLYFFIHLLVIPVEIILAIILDTKFRGSKFFKTTTFMPYIINGVAIAYAFSFFYSPVNGGLNELLKMLGMEGFIQNWLSDPKIVNYSLAAISIWKYSGYHIVLFLAALQSLPQETIEAAVIDGANSWQKFRFILLPGITIVLDFVLFSNVRGALQVFDIPFVITSGGPGYASSTFSLYTIDTAFKYNNFGMASTMGITIMFLIIVITLTQSRIVKLFRKD